MADNCRLKHTLLFHFCDVSGRAKPMPHVDMA